MARKASLIFMWTSICLFVISLTQTGFYVLDGETGRSPYTTGGGLLMLGAFSVFQGIYAWLANPLLLLSWFCIYFQAKGVALLTSIVAFIFAMSFFVQLGHKFHDGSISQTIAGPASGYMFWLVSTILGMFASTISMYSNSKTDTSPSAMNPQSKG
jgi:hypothetical protein